MTEDVQRDSAYLALSRSLYWQQRPRGSGDLGANQVREELLDFLGRLRADERVLIPLGEPNLDARTPLRRKAKFAIFRWLRFVTRRYERQLGDVVQLSAALAGRVAELEQEVEMLHQRLERSQHLREQDGPEAT